MPGSSRCAGVLTRCRRESERANTFACQSDSLSRMPSTSVRIDRKTHEDLKRIASTLGTTVGEAVAIAARRLRQEQIGKQLSTPLSEDEIDWLDAELG
jgi:uncharacterized protein YoaH (UPF0181 family)